MIWLLKLFKLIIESEKVASLVERKKKKRFNQNTCLQSTFVMINKSLFNYTESNDKESNFASSTSNSLPGKKLFLF